MIKETLREKFIRFFKELFCHHSYEVYPNEEVCAISCKKCGKTFILKTNTKH